MKNKSQNLKANSSKQKALNIAYQGAPGAYSYIATKHLYPTDQLVGFSSFEDVYEALKDERANYAVLPIENSLIGSIYENYDLLFEYDYKIRGEVIVKIDHNLLALPGSDIKKITKVYSHQKALDQCRAFFKARPWMEAIVYEDTAAAAKMVSEKKDPTIAAIASKTAGTMYGLEVLQSRIQSNQHNYTRFVVIGKENGIENADKTSLVFSAAHTPGSLIKCLRPFEQDHLNLTKLESRPLMAPKGPLRGSPWKYVFYLDFEHAPGKEMVEKEIEAIRPYTTLLRNLGNYQAGETIEE